MAKRKKVKVKGKESGNILWARLDPKKGNMAKVRVNAAKANMSICEYVDEVFTKVL